MKTNATIGNNIRLFREKMSLSQEDVADFLGTSREIVSYYETAKRDIPVEQLNRLSDLFGVDLIFLIEENADVTQVNVAFAFRANSLTTEDLNSIAFARKIVKNYLRMKIIVGKNGK